MSTTHGGGHAQVKRGGCFKTGCLGCLGFGVIVIALFVAYFFLEVIRGAPSVTPESRQLSHVIPGTPAPEPGSAAGSGAAVDPKAPDQMVSPQELAAGDDRWAHKGTGEGESGRPETIPALPVARLQPGRIVLDVSMSTFEIVPGPPGQPIRVEADYDTGSYELTESFEPAGELGWTYELTFRRTVSWLRLLMAGAGEPDNRIRLIIPRDVPVSLTGKVGIGESDLELGGLWLTDVALSIGVGEHDVSFREPLREPLEEIRLRSSIGEVNVKRLGNASPRNVFLQHSIGEVRYDLRGEWLNDSEIDVACGIGECSVRLPGNDVAVELIRAGVTIGEEDTGDVRRRGPAPAGAPTLRVGVSGTIGEVRVSD